MNAVIDISRQHLLRALDEARERFVRADEALKAFRFSYPARAEEFQKWRELRSAWDERDQELEAAREDLRDFDRGKLTGSN